MTAPAPPPMKIVAQNRRARFDYEIRETVEAGIILTGPEAKSCRKGAVNLSGSYVSFQSGKPVLKHAKIARYPFASPALPYDPERDRPLLLKTGEAQKLRAQSEEKGMTIVPLEVRAGRFIKVLLGLARGRKTLDKRARIRERDMHRKMKRGEEY